MAVLSGQPLWVFWLDPISSIGTCTEIIRPGSAPYELLTTGKLREDWGKWFRTPGWEAVGRLLYLGPPSLFAFEEGTWDPPYVRQNLGWGNMSLIVGQIKSFHHHPNKKEMNMMVSINLYGDVRRYIHLRYFWNCLCFGCKKTDLRLKQGKVSRGRFAVTLSNILIR